MFMPKLYAEDNATTSLWNLESLIKELKKTVSTRTGNDDKTETTKIYLFRRFLKSIRDNERHSGLADLVQHPQHPNQKTLRFVTLTQDKPNDMVVKRLLNTCMLCWALGKLYRRCFSFLSESSRLLTLYFTNLPY